MEYGTALRRASYLLAAMVDCDARTAASWLSGSRNGRYHDMALRAAYATARRDHDTASWRAVWEVVETADRERRQVAEQAETAGEVDA